MKKKYIDIISKLSESEFIEYVISSNCPSELNLVDDEKICEEQPSDCCKKCWEKALR